MGKRKPDTRTGSRHLDRHTVVLHGDEYDQLQKLAARNNRPLIWELRRILHAALEAENLWPPVEKTERDKE